MEEIEIGPHDSGMGPAPNEHHLSARAHDLYRLFNLLAVSLIAVLSLAAMVGWHLQIAALVQILPNYAPMQYTTAIGFLLCAIALQMRVMNHRRCSIAACLPVLILATISIADNITGLDTIGATQLIPDAFVTTRAPAPGLMSIFTGINLILCSSALISSSLHRRHRNTSWITAILSATAISTSLLGFISYALNATDAYSWLHIAQMSLPTVLNCLLLSIGIHSCAWMDHFRTNAHSPSWLPLAILFAFLNATFLMGNALHKQEDHSLKRIVFQNSLIIQTALTAELENRHHSIRRIAKRSSYKHDQTQQDWLLDAQAYLTDHNGYHSIVRTDRNMDTLWAASTDSVIPENILPESMSSEALLQMLARNDGVVTIPTNHRPGEFSIVASIVDENGFQGCIAAAVNPTVFFSQIFHDGIVNDYRFSITFRDQSIFQQGIKPEQTDHWATTQSLQVHGAKWTTTLWPDPEFIKSEHTFYSSMILYMGIIVSALIAVASRLFHISILRAREANSHNSHLQEEVQRRITSQEKLAQTMTELGQTHEKLMAASIQVGRAEVANNILHNVGNVLNSINITSSMLGDKIRQSRITSVGKTADLLDEHDHDLATFFSSDRRGKELPEFIRKLAARLNQEQENCLEDILSLEQDINHLRNIISMQQEYSKFSDIRETIAVEKLVSISRNMHASALESSNITIQIDVEPSLTVYAEGHKVIQILINLLSNAKHACLANHHDGSLIRVHARSKGDQCEIIVSDNGVGIEPENITLIFTHGFTTKKDGHGFGLHSSAIAAKEMKGHLEVASDGPGKGATFTLTLPHQQPPQEDPS